VHPRPCTVPSRNWGRGGMGQITDVGDEDEHMICDQANVTVVETQVSKQTQSVLVALML
jgi:hypothetical protein